jgi:hypothetical protein
MGFYIRKALKVGPVRFNLSRSGIGVSAGIKGFRVGSGPRGNYVHMGRGGLYFRQTLGTSRPPGGQPAPPLPVPPSPADATADPLSEIESASALQMVDGSSAELLQELKEKRQKARLFPGAVACSIVVLLIVVGAGSPSWLLAAVGAASLGLCWRASVRDALRRTTVIFYNLEPDLEQRYQGLHDAFRQLSSCVGAWHIGARGGVRDQRYHAGASTLVSRKSVVLQAGEPSLIKTNVAVPLIPVGRQVLAFMPDRLLVITPTAVGAVGYRDLHVRRTETKFIEEETVPNDATVVGKTWRYVNKSGGPDRRFKDNRELPMCLYTEISFSSESGLNEVIQLSRRDAGGTLEAALAGMGEVPEATQGHVG